MNSDRHPDEWVEEPPAIISEDEPEDHLEEFEEGYDPDFDCEDDEDDYYDWEVDMGDYDPALEDER